MEVDRKIILLGAGGHCLAVLDSLLSSFQYQTIGIVDKEKLDNGITDIMGVPILGGDEDLPILYKQGFTEAFITVGSVGNVSIRQKLYDTLKLLGFSIPNIIDKTSIVSNYAALGEGIYIGKRTVVNAYSDIKNMSIINTSSTIEHECRIGEYVHVAPGSVVCGNVSIDHGTHIGSGSVIKQGIHIGANVIIGIGSVVVKDIAANVTAYGNPCRVR